MTTDGKFSAGSKSRSNGTVTPQIVAHAGARTYAEASSNGVASNTNPPA
jgi:hypothetical protein